MLVVLQFVVSATAVYTRNVFHRNMYELVAHCMRYYSTSNRIIANVALLLY
jgi:hypothetical protein